MRIPYSDSDPDGFDNSELGDATRVGTTAVNLHANSKIGGNLILDFQTASQVTASINATAPDLSPYQTASQVTASINAAAPDLSPYQTASQVTASINAAAPDLSPYQISGTNVTAPGIDATSFLQTPAVVLTNNNGSSNLWRMKNETIYTSNGGSGVDSSGLSYNGTTKFKVGTSGNVHIDGMLFARYATNVSVQFLSDDRYKSRERPLPDDCVSIIQQLKPSRYLLHPNHEVPVDVEDSDLTGVETHDQAGLIAQDLEQIPELAFVVKEFEGRKTVNYNSLIPYLIKAVQELASR